MPDLVTTKKVRLGSHHLQPGRAKHTRLDDDGLREFPPFVALEIASYPSEQSCYLFHLCENGEGTDTWHQTVEEALDQAEWEFGVQRHEWVDVNLPFGSRGQ